MPTYDDSRYLYDSGLTYDGDLPVALTGDQPTASGQLTSTRLAAHRTLTGAEPAGTGTVTKRKIIQRLLEGFQPLTDLAVYDDSRFTYNDIRLSYESTGISQLTWRAAFHDILTGAQDPADGTEINIRVRHTTLTGAQPAPTGTGVGHRQRYLYGFQPVSDPVPYEDPRYTYDQPGIYYENASPGSLIWRNSLHRLLEGVQPASDATLAWKRLIWPWASYWPVVYDRPEAVHYITSVDTDDQTVRYQTTETGAPDGIVYREIAPLQTKERRL